MATLSQKVKLLKGLLTGEAAYTGPYYVTVDLTRRCNLRCLGCPYHSPYVASAVPDYPSTLDLPLPLMEKLCKGLKPMDTRSIILQGEGEPLLHPHILELVATVKNGGFHTILLTNGTLLERDLIRAFIDLKLDEIKVTLWATSPEEYRQNYPGTDPDNFQKVIERMKLTAEVKAEQKSTSPSVVLHFPINRNNYRGIERLGDLASGTGCNGLSFGLMYDVKGALDSYALSPAEEKLARQSLSRLRKRLNARSLNHNIDQALLRYDIGSAVWGKMPCYIPWFHARVVMDGGVRPCGRCQVSLGNLQDNTFSEIWNGPAFRSFRQKAIISNKRPFPREELDCSLCCLAADNMQVHRFFRWFSPFLRHPNEESSCSNR